jgi:hypothetical protein
VPQIAPSTPGEVTGDDDESDTTGASNTTSSSNTNSAGNTASENPAIPMPGN